MYKTIIVDDDAEVRNRLKKMLFSDNQTNAAYQTDRINQTNAAYQTDRINQTNAAYQTDTVYHTDRLYQTDRISQTGYEYACNTNNINETSDNNIAAKLSGEAEDGLEAMELFEAVKPNLVFMDINMPSESGLEVARKMLNRDRSVKIIIVTGYNEFEYAQQALKMGAFDILTKPVEPEIIKNSVKRACAALEAEKEEKIKLEKIEKMIAESLPVLKTRFMESLLEDQHTMSEEAIMDRLSYLGIDIENNYYNAAYMVPEKESGINMKNDILMFAIRNVTEEILLNSGIKSFIFNISHNNLVAVISYSDKSISQKTDSIFSDIREKLKFYLNVESYTGIGEETTKLKNISRSYRSACEALNYRNLFGSNNIVNIRDINKMENTSSLYGSREIEDILASFKTGDINSLGLKIKNILNRVVSASMGNMEISRRLFIELTASIARVCNELGIDDNHLYIKEDPYRKIMSFNNVVELKNWILQLYGELIAVLNEKRQNKVNRMIEIAKKFINDKYQEENLNLTMVSDYLGLSSVYFCQLFSQQTGSGFSEYLNALRINHAKRLLRESTSKIYEIAYETGYSNPKHFNKIFKKLTGMTPVEYRNSLGNSFT